MQLQTEMHQEFVQKKEIEKLIDSLKSASTSHGDRLTSMENVIENQTKTFQKELT